jgi:hypothetical protein
MADLLPCDNLTQQSHCPIRPGTWAPDPRSPMVIAARQSTPPAGCRILVSQSATITEHRVILSRRSLRHMLGMVWLLDGVLQLQSFMFTKGFAHLVIAPAASGQPFFVADPLTWNAHQIANHPVLLNALFAAIQLALGAGLLFGRTARLATVGSVLWATGVWFLGEGLGGLAGGHTTALVGAPGAALLYVILAVAGWPISQSDTTGETPTRQPYPSPWVLRAWAFVWVGFAILNLLPANLDPSTIRGVLTTNGSSSPSWLSGIDRTVASAVHLAGPGATVFIVALELAVGILVLGSHKLRMTALLAGMSLSALYWVIGQSFGQLFSGQATDPNTGPLLILLGLAALGSSQGLVPVHVQDTDTPEMVSRSVHRAA